MISKKISAFSAIAFFQQLKYFNVLKKKNLHGILRGLCKINEVSNCYFCRRILQKGRMFPLFVINKAVPMPRGTGIVLPCNIRQPAELDLKVMETLQTVRAPLSEMWNQGNFDLRSHPSAHPALWYLFAAMAAGGRVLSAYEVVLKRKGSPRTARSRHRCNLEINITTKN
jgi:hypothetical protein